MHGQEIVVFFPARVIRVGILPLVAHKGGRSRAVVPVGNIGVRDPGKEVHDPFFGCCIADNPEMMADAILCYEVVHRGMFLHVVLHDVVDLFHGRVGEEDGFHVGAVRTYMLHPVLFLVGPRQLMFPDDAVHIILYGCTAHNAILCQPSVLPELRKILNGLVVHLLCMHIHIRRKVDLRFDDMKQRIFIPIGFDACFF